MTDLGLYMARVTELSLGVVAVYMSASAQTQCRSKYRKNVENCGIARYYMAKST